MSNKSRWHNTFIGTEQQHTYWLYKVIDDVLVERPYISTFIEVGTGHGGLSQYFMLWAIARIGNFWSYDYQDRRSEGVKNNFIENPAAEFRQVNIFDDLDYLYNVLVDGPAFVFCDGDDKKKEVATIAPMLAPGSVIAAHDYGTCDEAEIGPGDITDGTLHPIHEDEWNKLPDNIMTCFYEKS